MLAVHVYFYFTIYRHLQSTFCTKVSISMIVHLNIEHIKTVVTVIHLSDICAVSQDLNLEDEVEEIDQTYILGSPGDENVILYDGNDIFLFHHA